MKYLTRQEIFDKVAVHFAGMENPAMEGMSCRYRTESGNKCFAGALIKNEHYNSFLEGRSAANSRVIEALSCSGVHEDDMVLVQELQSIHDQTWGLSYDNWEGKKKVTDKLKEFAADYGLSTVHPDLRQ